MLSPSPAPKVLFFLLTIGSLIAFGSLSIDMYLPAFGEIAKTFQVPVAQVQLSLTSFFVGLSLGQLLYGPLIDRFGRKPPIYLAVIIYTLASVMCSVSTSIEGLIFSRFLQALGACGGIVASRTVVRDLFNEREAARIFSLLMLVTGVAPVLAPLIGGQISTFIGWRGIFILLAVLNAICGIFVYLKFPETKGPNPHMPISNALKNYWGILGGKRFVGFALAGGIAQAGLFVYITGSPFVFIDLFHVPAQHYGWIFGTNAVGIIVASQINGKLLKKYAPEQILQVAFQLILLASLIILCVGIFQLEFPFLIVAIFLFMSSLGVTLPNTTAASLAGEGVRAGSASALLGTLQFGCATLASAAVSFLDNGTAMPMCIGMAICGASGWLLFQYTRKAIHRVQS